VRSRSGEKSAALLTLARELRRQDPIRLLPCADLICARTCSGVFTVFKMIKPRAQNLDHLDHLEFPPPAARANVPAGNSAPRMARDP
jgi:hypothetical protein